MQLISTLPFGRKIQYSHPLKSLLWEVLQLLETLLAVYYHDNEE